jgi:4-amino-4-deoxy-L-arabinose transferase-like glycosyltransferase
MRRQTWIDLLIVLALTSLAFAVRLYRLHAIPPGLYVDEAANGLDVLEILNGRFPIFFERNSGREPLFIYLQAVSAALLGATPFALRLTSSVLGALTVPAIYWMVREAFPAPGAASRWLGFWTASFAALSYWHITFSRLGFRAIMLPLVSAIAFAFFWRAWHRLLRGALFPWVTVVMCGVFVGLSLYTYLSARVLPFLVFGVGAAGIALCGCAKATRQRLTRALFVIAITALIVSAPLGLYFIREPQRFMGHASSVSVLNPSYHQGSVARALTESVAKTIGLFAVSGDPNPRHNPAQRPLLDPFLAAWLLFGLILSLIQWRSLPRLWATAWLGLFALPVVLGVQGMPHSLRGLGMLPAVCLLPVLAMDDARSWLASRLHGRLRFADFGLALLPLPFLLLGAYTGLRDYFSVWERDRGLEVAFEVESIHIADLLSQQGSADRVWILPLSPLYDGTTFNYTLDFAYRGEPGLGFVRASPELAPDQLNRLASGHNFGQVVHWLRASPPMTSGWLTYADPKHLIDFLMAKHGRLIESRDDLELPYSVYELPAEPDYRVASSYEPIGATFGGRVILTEAAFGRTASDRYESAAALDQHNLPAGRSAWIALRWQAQQPVDHDLKASLRLLDPDGHLAGQVDDLLVGDSYPFTRTWSAGENASTYHILPTLPAVAPGPYQLHVVVYDPRTGVTYPATVGGSSEPGPGFPIGALKITRPLSPPEVAPEHAPPTGACPWADLCLLGYDLPAGQINPGDTLPLTLYWRAMRKPAADYQIEVRLREATGREMVSQRSGPNNDRYPATRWETGEVVRDWHDLPVSPTSPGGAYTLTLNLHSGGQDLGEIALGSVEVSGRPRSYRAPEVQHPMAATFGEAVALIGHDSGGSSWKAGETFSLVLHWQALRRIRHSYTVFVHILDANGQIVAQQDSLPGQGSLPTSSWTAGEYITDPYSIPLPKGLAPGDYRVRIGFYDAATGARLSVSDAGGRAAGDSVVLAQPLTIAAP